MQALPHHYNVQVNSTPDSQLIASSKGIPDLVVAGPAEFDGPGDQWSPETLLLSAVANCFVLSFKAVANASKFAWEEIHCESTGKLEKVDRLMKFTQITTKVRLVIKDETEKEMALKLLKKSEAICLVSNSLNCELKLECDIVTGA
ncbi:MAG: OsmC family protein [Psychromonas sp.]